jgi:hypothetical protein
MNKTLALLALLLSATLSMTAAQAHQIWIEQAPGQNAVIRFGEFGENLREVSPGLLDKMGRPAATLISASGPQAADGKKTGNGFALPFKAGKGESIVAEDANYPLYTYKDVTNQYLPAARLVTGFTVQEPRLTLDLLPTTNAGEFKLFFKGKVLPKVKVALVTQSGWAKEGVTDEQGLVKFDMPWRGTYVAEVSHKERLAGTRQGANGPENFQGVDYVTTLTYVKPDGLAPAPAGPAATPGK